MPDLGNEFIIESYKIPWLIWIQLLVMILLIILILFGFSIFTSDVSPGSSSASTSTGGAGAGAPPTRRRTEVEAERARRDEEASAEFIREDDQNGEESSSKNSTFLGIFRHPNHPCNFLGLPNEQFLGVLAWIPAPSSPNSHQHDKQE